MNNIQFSWRWIGLIVIAAILAGAQSLPWPIVAVTLAAGGGYLLYYGWQKWTGGAPVGGGGKRVTYWRGQKIELPAERRSSNLPSVRSIGPSVIYFLIGGALVLGALGIVLQRTGV
ncbi:MAG: hypothetical protein HC876_09335 [Chloroflexaceae bacterium]|nr:hypothetical protein [Chloroflexaceae bacterium]NJO05697.1 hypothetical protein [Chloroflexaceae bacterium]